MKYLFTSILSLVCVGLWGQKTFGPQTHSSAHRSLTNLEGVIFHEGFDNVTLPNLPAEWTTDGLSDVDFYVGTGGTAPGQANENGFWPVPFHGTFALTNDDACNCDKSQDRLTSKVIDATYQTYLKIIFDAFQNGNSGQHAFLQVRSESMPWTTILDIEPRANWTTHEAIVPREFYDSGFQFRFFYDDQGNYASGLAIDDIYIINEPTSRYSLDEFYSFSGDDPGSDQDYTLIPLSQARNASMHFGGLVTNDDDGIKNGRLRVNISGPINWVDSTNDWHFTEFSEGDLSFSRRNRFSPYLPGDYAINAVLITDSVDQETSDNTGDYNFTVGDSVYQRLPNSTDGTGIWVQSDGDRVGAVYHLYQPDSISSVNLGIHSATEDGARFRVKIFHYDTLTSSIYSSSPFQVNAADIGTVVKLPIRHQLSKGKYLFVIELESGRLILKSNSNFTSENGNALSYKVGQGWNNFAYFPQLDVVMTPIDTNCKGHMQFQVEDESCPNQNDGSVSIEMFDAKAPLTYTWSNSAGSVSSITNLSPGPYSVEVEDDDGCIYTRNFSVKQADSIAINPLIILDSCGKNTGSIDLQVSGGESPYTIDWNGNIGFEINSSLEKGSYQINIVDVLGCEMDTSIYVDGTDDIGIAFLVIPSGCGDSNGLVTFTPFGTGPFTQTWGTGASGDTLDSLPSGIYPLTLIDSIGCQTTSRAFVPDSNAPTIGLNSLSNVSCFGANDGAIEIQVTSNHGAEVLWNSGDTSTSISDLDPNEYLVSVNDSLGCTAFASYEIHDVSTPLVVDLIETGNYCHEGENGALEIIVTGGSPAYSLQWSTGGSSTKISSLIAGNYTVTVTDNDGCKQIMESSISDGPLFFIKLDSVEYDTGGSILDEGKVFATVLGGVEPHTSIWNDSIEGPNLINVPPGDYTLIATDQLGCTTQFDYTLLNGPEGIAFPATPEIVQVYPNPGQTHQNIQLKSSEPIINIELRDSQGRLIKTQPVDGKELYSLPLNGVSTGVYLLQIRTESHFIAKRLLVNR